MSDPLLPLKTEAASQPLERIVEFQGLWRTLWDTRGGVDAKLMDTVVREAVLSDLANGVPARKAIQHALLIMGALRP